MYQARRRTKAAAKKKTEIASATRDTFRDIQELANSIRVFFIPGNPAGAHPICLKPEDQVLGRGATVFQIIFCITLTKNGETDDSIRNELSVIGERCNFFESFLCMYHANQPRLKIHSCWCMNCTFYCIVDEGFINRIRFEFSHAVPSFNNRGYNIHASDMEKRRIKRLWRGIKTAF